MNVNQIKEIIKTKFNIQEENIKCYSRLLKKNIVFKVVIGEKSCAIKVYVLGDNLNRQKREQYMYEYFLKNKTIFVPNIENIIVSEIGPIMIIDWVDGISIKEKVKLQGLNNVLGDIKSMLIDMNKIWEQNAICFPFLEKDRMGIEYRLSNDLNCIKNIIQSQKKYVDFSEFFSYYDKLRDEVIPNFNKVINSDISTHEYIIQGNKAYWIDLESFCIGDPNNDLARSFVSLTSGIYDNKDFVNKIYNIYEQQSYFNKNVFFYYLCEKIMCSIYDAPLQMKDEEFEFYNIFIKEKMCEKQKQLLK